MYKIKIEGAEYAKKEYLRNISCPRDRMYYIKN
jgi:hypothetical protein